MSFHNSIILFSCTSITVFVSHRSYVHSFNTESSFSPFSSVYHESVIDPFSLLTSFLSLQVRDFKHRYVDVMGGGMLGITIAVGMVGSFFNWALNIFTLNLRSPLDDFSSIIYWIANLNSFQIHLILFNFRPHRYRVAVVDSNSEVASIAKNSREPSPVFSDYGSIV